MPRPACRYPQALGGAQRYGFSSALYAAVIAQTPNASIFMADPIHRQHRQRERIFKGLIVGL